MEQFLIDNITWVVGMIGLLAGHHVRIAMRMVSLDAVTEKNAAEIKRINEEELEDLRDETDNLHDRITRKDQAMQDCIDQIKRDIRQMMTDYASMKATLEHIAEEQKRLRDAKD